MKSMEAFGQQKPIVVGDNNFVVAGNGFLEAAKRMGWKRIQIVRTELSSEDELRYMIADNKTSDLSEFDFNLLAGIVSELDGQGVDLSPTGFTRTELEPLISAGQLEAAPRGTCSKSTNEDLPNVEVEALETALGRFIIVFEDDTQKQKLCKLLNIDGEKVVYTAEEVGGD
jgi:hypothetical protein